MPSKKGRLIYFEVTVDGKTCQLKGYFYYFCFMVSVNQLEFIMNVIFKVTMTKR